MRQYYAERKAAGVCTYCGKWPARTGRLTCTHCAEEKKKRTKKEMDRIQARIGGRHIVPEWKIQEIEAARNWAKAHPARDTGVTI